MSKYLERAKEIRAIVEPHHNCAQSMLMTFNKDAGVSDELAFKMGACFGLGMKTGGTCGVITGALMLLGLFGVDDVPTTKRVVEFVKEKHEGMIYCADLLRVNAERGGERKPHCDAMVYEMVEFVEGILREKGKIE